MNKDQIRMMAMTERLMDEGKLKWVMAPSPAGNGRVDRLPVGDDIMEELGLENGQTINNMIFDAIVEASIRKLKTLIQESAEMQEAEIEDKLDGSFDFRKLMNEGGDEPTKH